MTLLPQEKDAIVRHYAEAIRLAAVQIADTGDINRGVLISAIRAKLDRLEELVK